MSEEKMDIAKVLAILAQPQEKPEPLENVDRLKLEVPYITKENVVETRAVHVVMPQGKMHPLPLVYVPHYEMGEDSLELRDYLAKGWAVACPGKFNDNYNGKLTDDDLVFNNAALYTLRHRPEFDKKRIILVGGSAGGYTTLMLNGLQLGLCASVANGPITNVYFSYYYGKKVEDLNRPALEKIAAQKAALEEHPEMEENQTKDNAALEFMQSLASVPMPFLAGLSGNFSNVYDNFPDQEDMRRWELFSGVGIADCFCSPIMVNHCTSDILVPVDQISKKFTYKTPGDSLPREFDARIPLSFPGKLKYSLEECLPETDTRTERFIVPKKADPCPLPYDPNKRFNINIFDDGPMEGYGTHSSRMDVGRRFDVPYLEEMFERTAAETCILTAAMLKSLLIRYQGKSLNLPAHIGVDDSIYGSLCIYRKEICEELKDWMTDHGETALQKIFEDVLANEDDAADREMLKSAMDEILQII